MCKQLTQQFKMLNTVDLMTISKLENKKLNEFNSGSYFKMDKSLTYVMYT